jgi:3'-5' exonuclease
VFKTLQPHVWAFDAEWVPDPVTGRAVYGLPDQMTDEDVVATMYERGGATEEEPRPYLKTILCRIVSVSVVTRNKEKDGVKLQLTSLPSPSAAGIQPLPEAELVQRFLEGVGRSQPQLVGYNSGGADLRILVQRGVSLGVQAADFARRPDKPWEGVDYFAPNGDWHVDLQEVLAGRSRGRPSLHELAVASGIPGKLDVAGTDVQDLWAAGRIDRIVAYNECDAITTYLLWIRVAHFAGFYSADEYVQEQDRVRELLEREAQRPERSYLAQYLTAWTQLASRTGGGVSQMGLGI